MNRNFNWIACSTVLLALPFSVFAAGDNSLSYNYLGAQAGYADVDGNFGGDSDGPVLGVDGSAELVPNVNLVGSYSHSFLDNADLDMVSLGGGLHTDLNYDRNIRIDAFGTLTYEYINLDPDRGPNADDSGFGIRGGLRAKFENNLEANASLGYVDYGSIDGPVAEFGGLYSLPRNENVALSLSYRYFDFDGAELDQLLAGIRFYIN